MGVQISGDTELRMVTNGAVDRALHGWIADGCSISTIKNTLAVLVRVMEQAVRDGIIDRNPAKVTNWQHEYRKAEDELGDPRSLALPNWATLTRLADALVTNSWEQYAGWGDVGWDEVVTKLGYEHLRRHDLRHTGLTWMAYAGVKPHDLQKIADHASLTTTQRYLHSSDNAVSDAGTLLSKHLRRPRR